MKNMQSPSPPPQPRPILLFRCSVLLFQVQVFQYAGLCVRSSAEVSTGKQLSDDEEYRMRQTLGALSMFSCAHL